MDREYWQTQVSIIDILTEDCGGIIALNIDDVSMRIITPFVDEDVIPCIDELCASKDLCYVYTPHTLAKKRNGKLSGVERPAVMWKFLLPEENEPENG